MLPQPVVLAHWVAVRAELCAQSAYLTPATGPCNSASGLAFVRCAGLHSRCVSRKAEQSRAGHAPENAPYESRPIGDVRYEIAGVDEIKGVLPTHDVRRQRAEGGKCRNLHLEK